MSRVGVQSRRGFVLGLAGACASVGCACVRPAAGRPVAVFAAVSLERALRAVIAAFERATTGAERGGISTNFAGSNVLARQIESARAADLFFSADERWMDYLEQRQLLEPGTRRALLGNSLVIVARRDSPHVLAAPQQLAGLGFDRLVLADPELVPAGRYAKQYLESVPARGGSLWSELRARVAPALDVRAAVGAVLADRRRVGIVYASDLVQAPELKALLRVPAQAGPRIVYPAALVRRAGEESAAGRRRARELLDYCVSAPAARLFERHGLRVLAQR